MCLRVSYLNYDPMDSEKQSAQFLASERVVRIQTGLKKGVDSLFSGRLLDKNAQSQLLLKEELVNATQITFQYDFGPGFVANQVVCMWFDAPKLWTSADCNTIYDLKAKEVRCLCRELHPDAFYALVLDVSRADLIPDPHQPELEAFVYERDWRIYILLLFIFFFVFFGTFAACCLDSIDFSRTEQLLK